VPAVEAALQTGIRQCRYNEAVSDAVLITSGRCSGCWRRRRRRRRRRGKRRRRR
jgi:hypothetical protein